MTASADEVAAALPCDTGGGQSARVVPRRIILDVSTVCRWTGPVVGIVRVESQLARWAGAHLDAVVFAFFDPVSQRYLRMRPGFFMQILQGECAIATWELPDAGMQRRHFEERLAPAIQPAARWLLHFRREVLMALERRRTTTRNPRVRQWIDTAQRSLMSEKYQRMMVQSDGSRRSMLTPAQAFGEPVELGPNDILVCAGSSWGTSNIEAIARQKRASGFQFVTLCFDLIPILFRQHYREHDTANFERHFRHAFPIADLVIVNARRIEQDVRDWCVAQGLPAPRTAVIPLGSDGAKRTTGTTALARFGLERGRYIPFVSTIEPRKGHRVVYEAWCNLVREGIPQARGFKLVFVGRPGWMVDELLARLRSGEGSEGTLVLIADADDAALAALYENAAFCVYPSEYEGYGLPIIEAFNHGKAVIASTGGAIPEVVGELSPCLDPHDVAAWRATLRQWLTDDTARAGYETKIRERFHNMTWDEVAARFFAEVGSLAPPSGP